MHVTEKNNRRQHAFVVLWNQNTSRPTVVQWTFTMSPKRFSMHRVPKYFHVMTYLQEGIGGDLGLADLLSSGIRNITPVPNYLLCHEGMAKLCI